MDPSIQAFDAYAAEFKSLLQPLETESPCSTPLYDEITDNAVTTPKTHQQIMDQCHDLLQQMALEARGVLDFDNKRMLLDQYRVYKSQWQVRKIQIEKQILMMQRSTTVTTEQDNVLSSSTINHNKNRCQENETVIAKQNATLTQATQKIYETEQMATEIASQLHQNRETMERTQSRTREVATITTRANQIATNLLKPWWRKGISN